MDGANTCGLEVVNGVMAVRSSMSVGSRGAVNTLDHYDSLLVKKVSRLIFHKVGSSILRRVSFSNLNSC